MTIDENILPGEETAGSARFPAKGSNVIKSKDNQNI